MGLRHERVKNLRWRFPTRMVSSYKPFTIFTKQFNHRCFVGMFSKTHLCTLITSPLTSLRCYCYQPLKKSVSEILFTIKSFGALYNLKIEFTLWETAKIIILWLFPNSE